MLPQIFDASLPDALKAICEFYESERSDARCSISVLDAESRRIRLVAVAKLPFSFAQTQEGDVNRPGRGSAIAAISRRERVFSEDIANDPAWVVEHSNAMTAGVRSSCSIPIYGSDGEVIAALTAYSAVVGKPDSAQMQRAEIAASLVATAIQHDRTRNELIESRTRLELAQEIARLGYWERDVTTQRFVITREVGRLIGASATSVINVEDLLALVVEEDRSIIVRALTEVSENSRTLGPVEFRVRHPVEGIRHVIVQRKAIRNETGVITKVIGTVQDVTEEREAKLRLQQSEERFRMVAEHTGQLILDCRLDVGEVHCAGAVREILGNIATDGKPLELGIWRKIVHPEDLGIVEQAIRRVLHGERASVTCRFQRSGGEILDVEVTGSAILNEQRWATRIIATVSNISDRRRAETERQRYLAQLAFLADAARKVNSVVSVAELLRNITEIARDLVGAHVSIGKLLPDEAWSEGLLSLCASNLYSSLEESQLDSSLSTFGAGRMLPVRRARAAMTDDEEQDPAVLLQLAGTLIVPILKPAGDVWGEICVADKHDGDFGPNDERVLGQLADLAAVGIENARLYAGLEARVRRRTQELEHSNRELEAFSYSVSHDLRGPLRAISGFAGLLRERHYEHLDDESRRYMDRIEAGTLRMSSLIDDLLELGRVTRMELRREPVDLSTLAQAVALRMQERSPGREGEFAIQPGLRAIGDARLLEIVLENLFDNAWKFTAARTAARIDFGLRDLGQEQAFFVQDNGVGFDPRYATNLFGVFQRLHSNADFPGTGVGLATVQRIVQRHGGRIWADAEVEQGAAFYFTIAGE
ncbi:MAG: GAF domain-containing protein [Povalibacter sp.]